MSSLEQSRLDDYEIAGPLGSGATARVFEARHVGTGRAVAIKMLDASARGNRELRERLAREAAFLVGVQSPYVSRLLGFGWESDQPFLVLERLDGETLGDVLKRETRLDAARLVEWIEQLLIGLRDCHNANVIHRDVKPSNVFLAERAGGEPVVKLIDFGVARLNELAKAGTSLTSTHHLIGSMGYMAPEQLEYAKGVAPGADLYAVGVVIFRCVSGRLPFVGRSFDALTKLKCESTAPLLSSMPGVNANPLLDAFVAKSLARLPDERYASASEMLQEWWRVAAALDRDVPLAEGHDVVFEEEDPSNTLVDADGNPTNPSHASSISASHPTHPSGSGTGSGPHSSGPATERMLPVSTTLVEKDVPTDTGSNPFGVISVHGGEDAEEPTKKRAL